MHYDFDHTPDRRETECSKWNAYGEEVLPLPVADMDFPSPLPVRQALLQRVEHGVFGYPEHEDACKSPLLYSLQELILERLQRLYGWTVEPEALVYFPGVVPGLNIACHALAGAGDGILIQPPVYPPFLGLAKNAGALAQQALLVRSASGSYEIDWDIFESSFTSQTRVFVLCNPHNPVGRVFRRDELERMAAACLLRGVTLVSDEIHCDLLYPGQRHIPLASLDPEIARSTITLMAPSKTFNLAGLFFSFAIIPDADLRKRFQDARQGRTGGVNLFGLVAAEAAYRDGQEWLDQLLAYLGSNRDTLFDYVQKELPGVHMTPPEGTYLAWLDCTQSAAYQAGSHRTPYHFFLDRAKVALQDGRWFGPGGEGFVRLNFGCSRRVLAEALSRMKAALSEA